MEDNYSECSTNAYVCDDFDEDCGINSLEEDSVSESGRLVIRRCYRCDRPLEFSESKESNTDQDINTQESSSKDDDDDEGDNNQSPPFTSSSSPSGGSDNNPPLGNQREDVSNNSNSENLTYIIFQFSNFISQFIDIICSIISHM